MVGKTGLNRVDVDELFETTGVLEIKSLSENLTKDYDQKREDLRTMVGERYRDLMEAADTIIKMKETAGSVVDHIRLIQDNIYPDEVEIKDEQNEDDQDLVDESDLALGAQIKLLMDCSEMMWTGVDHEDYLAASVVYLLARHVHTNLCMQDTTYPIVARQWDSILPFKQSIIQGCHQVLIEPEPSSILGSLAALVLLQGIDTKTLFLDFLKLKETALKTKMTEDNVHGARAKIKTFLMAVTSCIRTVNSAFLGSESGLDKALEAVCNQPVLKAHHTSSMGLNLMEHLPTVVSAFAPSVIMSSEDKPVKLTAENVTKECTSWLDRIHDLTSDSGMLNHVHSLKDLSLIRKTVHDFLKHILGDWNENCCQVLGKEINLWNEFFRGVFRDRVEALISLKVNQSLQFLEKEMTTQTSEEISSYMWTETTDLDNTFKSKAYPPNVQKTCQELNKKFEHLMDELTDYMGDPNPLFQPPNDEPFDMKQDNKVILEFVQKHMLSAAENVTHSVRNGAKDPLHAARLGLAVQELCPAFKRCGLSTSLLQTSWLQTSTLDAEWCGMLKAFHTMSCHVFTDWIRETQLPQFRQQMQEYLSFDAESDLKHVLPEWDAVDISEEGEDGNVLQSTIRVPCQISLALHLVLEGMCRAVYASGWHAVPQEVQAAVPTLALESLLGVYEARIRDRKLAQNVALQLHFDVQFMLQVMTVRSEQPAPFDVLSSLEQHVDPFDLSVFMPYINVNVKRAVVRHQTAFGALIPSEKFALLTSMKGALLPSGHPGFTNAMLISTSSARFPLLPIAASSSSSTAQRAASLLSSSLIDTKQTKANYARKRDRSPVAKAAGSFFEAMSTSWFGGK